jgi:hypothetical protein
LYSLVPGLFVIEGLLFWDLAAGKEPFNADLGLNLESCHQSPQLLNM